MNRRQKINFLAKSELAKQFLCAVFIQFGKLHGVTRLLLRPRTTCWCSKLGSITYGNLFLCFPGISQILCISMEMLIGTGNSEQKNVSLCCVSCGDCGQ